MRPTLLRILKHGGLAAAVLAAIGFVLAEAAGAYLGGWADPVAADLRRRLPFGMAAWGVGLVAAFELLAALFRSHPPDAEPLQADPAEGLWADLRRRVDPPAAESSLPDPSPRGTMPENTPPPAL